MLRISLLAATVAMISYHSSASEVSDIEKEVRDQAESQSRHVPDLCDLLSEDACLLVSRGGAAQDNTIELDVEDRLILSDLLKITPESAQTNNTAIDASRARLLETSAMSFGVQVGVAVEAARFNKLWAEYSTVYEQAADFDHLLLEHGAGRNIVPPVIRVVKDSQEIGSGGRVFRVSGVIFRIEKQPRFVITAPSWKTYLRLDVREPEMPVAGFLPQNAEESAMWKKALVKGYLEGVELTRKKVMARFRSLTSDYVGMVTYHLLRTLNMVSAPKIETNHTPVVATAQGSIMAVDDTISVLSVVPTLNGIRDTWKAYPQIKKISQLQREMINRFNRGATAPRRGML